MSFLRRRKGHGNAAPTESDCQVNEVEEKKEGEEKEKTKEGGRANKRRRVEEKKIKKWSCVDRCCWFIGFICCLWWVLLFLYNALPASLPQYVTERITGPLPDPPGVKLKKEGLTAKHPVVFVPGIVTGGLELWEGRSCAEGLFRKRVWGGTFGELYKRY